MLARLEEGRNGGDFVTGDDGRCAESKRTKGGGGGGGGGKHKSNKAPAAATDAVTINTTKKKRAKTDNKKREAEELIRSACAMGGANTTIVYDTFRKVAKGLRLFLWREGVTKKMLLRVLGKINNNSMRKFFN